MLDEPWRLIEVNNFFVIWTIYGDLGKRKAVPDIDTYRVIKSL
jgi:hypothetical protein